MPEAYANVLQYLNVFLTCVFAIEAALKLAGFGFYVCFCLLLLSV